MINLMNSEYIGLNWILWENNGRKCSQSTILNNSVFSSVKQISSVVKMMMLAKQRTSTGVDTDDKQSLIEEMETGGVKWAALPCNLWKCCVETI